MNMPRPRISRVLDPSGVSTPGFEATSARIPAPRLGALTPCGLTSGIAYMCGTKKELKPLGHKKSAYEAGRRLPNTFRSLFMLLPPGNRRDTLVA